MNANKNIVVFGGGSAGWITALLAQSYYPRYKITLIESDSIGILGAGEGTTPHFINFLDKVDISVSDLVKNCKATIKHGINFENWNGNNEKYFHSFGSKESLDEWHSLLATKHLAQNLKVDELNFPKKITQQKKVGFSFTNSVDVNENLINSFSKHASFGLHFDARLLAQYFRKVAEKRGVVRIEGELKAVASDEQKCIKQIQLKNDINVDCDFVFDCSGFARILIGKFFQSEWISYDKYLPMNTALPFFIEHNNDVEPQTDAIAMKYGWVWRIPVEGRYGCGYVFDSNYINEEQAIEEAENYFKQKLISPKTFKFNAGTFKNTFIQNCMAVGLSQSFVEPLEATSIWASYLTLNDFFSSDGIHMKSETFRKKFNERCLERNNEIRNFLYLHYLTQRNDSLFWQEFRQKHPMISEVQEILDLINENEYSNLNLKCFSNHSWIQVAGGLNLLDLNSFKERLSRFDTGPIDTIEHSFLRNQNNVSKICISHKEFLEYLRQ